jgi:uncharacterized membrane protein
MLTHFPIVGTVGGLIILIAGYFISNPIIKRTALLIFAGSALIAIPAFLTGEGAEEAVEKLPGVMESFIEEHEEIAEIYIWLIAVWGIISAVGVIYEMVLHKQASVIYTIVLILALASTFISYKVGNYGGQIRHTELRANSGEIIQQENFKTDNDD